MKGKVHKSQAYVFMTSGTTGAFIHGIAYDTH